VDDIEADAYNALRKEFIGIFEEEDKSPAEYDLRRASMRKPGA